MDCPMEVDDILSALDKEALVDMHALIKQRYSESVGDEFRLPPLVPKPRKKRHGRQHLRYSAVTAKSSLALWSMAPVPSEDRRLLRLVQLVDLFLKTGCYHPQRLHSYVAGIVELFGALSDRDNQGRALGVSWIHLVDYLLGRAAFAANHGGNGRLALAQGPDLDAREEADDLAERPAWSKCPKFVDSATHPGEYITSLQYCASLDAVITTHRRCSAVSVWLARRDILGLVHELHLSAEVPVPTRNEAISVSFDPKSKVICVLYAGNYVGAWEKVPIKEEKKIRDKTRSSRTKFGFTFRAVGSHKLTLGQRKERILLSQIVCIKHEETPWLMCDTRGGFHLFALEIRAGSVAELSHAKSLEGIHSAPVTRLVGLASPTAGGALPAYLLSTSSDGTFCLLESSRLMVEARVTPWRDLDRRSGRSVVRSVAYSPQQSLLVVATSSTVLAAYTLEANSFRGFKQPLVGHAKPLSDVASCLDGTYVASIDEGSRVIVWDAASLSIVSEVPGGLGQLNVLGRLLTPLPNRLLLAGKRFYIIRPNSGAKKRSFFGGTGSSDGNSKVVWATLNEASGRLVTLDATDKIVRHRWSPGEPGRVLVGGRTESSPAIAQVHAWSSSLDGGCRDMLVVCRADGLIEIVDQFSGVVTRRYPSLAALALLHESVELKAVDHRVDCSGNDLSVAAPGPVKAVLAFTATKPTLAVSTSCADSNEGGPVWLFCTTPGYGGSGRPRCYRAFHPGSKRAGKHVTCTSLAHEPSSATLLCGCEDGKIYRYALQPFSCLEVMDVALDWGGITDITVVSSRAGSDAIHLAALHGDDRVDSSHRITLWRASRPITAARRRSSAGHLHTADRFVLMFSSGPLDADWQPSQRVQPGGLRTPVETRGSLASLVILSPGVSQGSEDRANRSINTGSKSITLDLDNGFLVVNTLNGSGSVVCVSSTDQQNHEAPSKGLSGAPNEGVPSRRESKRNFGKSTSQLSAASGNCEGRMSVLYTWSASEKGAQLPLQSVSPTGSGQAIVVCDRVGGIWLFDILSGDLLAHWSPSCPCGPSWLALRCVSDARESLLKQAADVLRQLRPPQEPKDSTTVWERRNERVYVTQYSGRVGEETKLPLLV
ncbi:hypothetical protein FOZ61_001478 [Perkinsus olseni]|uniref:Uncharacterized protein n=1 Tax=Perkinsus olseni TaxID=32597 RepID=A0A7J6LWM2_PEROL|nr:hypothetical protein FOZ61_001478 [Perkinsus olseni]